MTFFENRPFVRILFIFLLVKNTSILLDVLYIFMNKHQFI